jgi:hypothetical protein
MKKLETDLTCYIFPNHDTSPNFPSKVLKPPSTTTTTTKPSSLVPRRISP